jgi:hypothetical protein
MKSKLITLLAVAATLGSASATTITGSGGTTGAQFITSAGTMLTSANASILCGSMSGNIFTRFAIADVTPIVLGSSGVLLGRWSSSFADTSATAVPFNGLQVWFKVTTTADNGGVGYFGSTLNFPSNGGGVGDSLSVAASTLSSVNSTDSSTGTAAFHVASVTYPNGFVTIGVVPEPSAALLGAFGVLGLLRRRRN